jgi:hypothetical protein
MRKLFLSQVDLCFNHHGTKWVLHQFLLLTHMDLVMFGLSISLWTVQNRNPNQDLRYVKTLTLHLNNYQVMLNIGSQGKEGVPFLLY